MTRLAFPPFSPQNPQHFLMGHQSLSPMSPQTIHVACPRPKKEWSVISMVKFNPIHLNMHRQGPVGTRASFITPQLPLLPCSAVCVCVHGSGPDLSWRRGRKMMGAQRDRQSNRAFKLASDSVRLWFSSLFFCLCEARGENSSGCLVFYPPPPPSSSLTHPLSFNIGNFRVTTGPSGR